MAKKKKVTQKEEDAPLPKFGGFNALAAGLGDIKARVDAEAKAKVLAGQKPVPVPVARPAMTAPKRTALSSAEKEASDRDDEHTFHRMMSGVTPLADRQSRVPVAGTARIEGSKLKPADLRARAAEEAKSVLEHLHHLVDDAVRFEVTDDGRRVEGRRFDVPPGVLRELRHGAMPIDGRLDLHGLGAEAARTALLDFLKAQRARGERCLLVIHGKGDHSLTPGGVLRGEISAWLSQGRAREHVAAFATAREDDGGEGAVYVALRR